MNLDKKELILAQNDIKKINVIDDKKLKEAELSLNKKIQQVDKDILELNNQRNQNKIYFQELIHSNLIIEDKIDKLLKNKSNLIKINSNLLKEEKLRENLILINSKLDKILSLKEKINLNLDKLQNKEKEFSIEMSEIKINILNRNENLEILNKRYVKFKENVEEFNRINYQIKFLEEKLLPTSTDIERTLFTKFWVEFNEYFVMIFKDLIEDQEFDVYLRDDFSIIVEQNGYEIDISNLSGGEKSSLAIAYRLALKKIIESNLGNLNKLNLLILDEPTDGFSEQQISRLGHLLKQSNLEQIILVSHDEKIESIAEHILFVEKKNHISNIRN